MYEPAVASFTRLTTAPWHRNINAVSRVRMQGAYDISRSCIKLKVCWSPFLFCTRILSLRRQLPFCIGASCLVGHSLSGIMRFSELHDLLEVVCALRLQLLPHLVLPHVRREPLLVQDSAMAPAAKAASHRLLPYCQCLGAQSFWMPMCSTGWTSVRQRNGSLHAAVLWSAVRAQQVHMVIVAVQLGIDIAVDIAEQVNDCANIAAISHGPLQVTEATRA